MTEIIVKSGRKFDVVNPLYQWDKNVDLKITGLECPSTPEVHFTNSAMSRAIVRTVTMNEDGSFTVNIPNQLLTVINNLVVLVCFYDGEEFRTKYKLTVEIVARPKPEDYIIPEEDEDAYSWRSLNAKIESYKTGVNDRIDGIENHIISLVDSRLSDQTTITDDKIQTVDAKVDVVNARVNNVIATDPGSTRENAELLDIRVGADGKTYPTAGEAVRGQINNQKMVIDNIFDYHFVNGYYNVTSGNFVADDRYTACQSYLPIDSIKEVSIAKTGAILYYSADHKLLLGFTNSSEVAVTEINPPDKAVYVRYHVYKNRPGYIKCDNLALQNSDKLRDVTNANRRLKTDSNGIVRSTVADWIKKKYLSKAGVISNTTSDKFACSDMIDISTAYKIEYYAKEQYSSGLCYAFYDDQKSFISGGLCESKKVVTIEKPDQAQFVCFAFMDSTTTFNDCYYIVYDSFKRVYDLERSIAPLVDINKIFDGVGFEIFRKFGVVGDSLSVGFTKDKDQVTYDRNIEYSWGQFMARRMGNTCLNFGVSGIDSKTWYKDTRCRGRLIDPQNLCQAYILCLGVNDTSHLELGSIDDVNYDDMTQNGDTIYGWYSRVIQTINDTAPNAPIFVFTMPYPVNTKEKAGLVNDMIRYFCNDTHFQNLYLVDLDADYNQYFVGRLSEMIRNTGWHFTTLGYAYISMVNQIALSKTIYNNSADFQDAFLLPYGSNDVLD